MFFGGMFPGRAFFSVMLLCRVFFSVKLFGVAFLCGHNVVVFVFGLCLLWSQPHQVWPDKGPRGLLGKVRESSAASSGKAMPRFQTRIKLFQYDAPGFVHRA